MLTIYRFSSRKGDVPEGGGVQERLPDPNLE